MDAVALGHAGTGDADPFDTGDVFFALTARAIAAVRTTDHTFAVRFTRFRNTLKELVAEVVIRASTTGLQIACIESTLSIGTGGNALLLALSIFALIAAGADPTDPGATIGTTFLVSTVGLAHFASATTLICTHCSTKRIPFAGAAEGIEGTDAFLTGTPVTSRGNGRGATIDTPTTTAFAAGVYAYWVPANIATIGVL